MKYSIGSIKAGAFVLASTLASTCASAAVFTSGNDGNFGFAGNNSFPGYGAAWSTGMQGQAFRASTNASPDLGALSTVFLQDMTFFLGGFDNNAGDTQTTLSIYTPGVNIAGSTLVGVSSNTLDSTNATGSGDAYDFSSDPHTGVSYTFNFDNLALDYETTYLAVFTDGLGNAISLDITQGFEGNSFVQAYDAGVGGFDVGGLFDYDASGWSTNTNADFTATFSTTSAAVPLPAALPLFGAALLGLRVVGRRRS